MLRRRLLWAIMLAIAFGDESESSICASLNDFVAQLNAANPGSEVTCEPDSATAACLKLKVHYDVVGFKVEFGFYVNVDPCDSPPAFILGVDDKGRFEDVVTLRYGDNVDVPIPGLGTIPSDLYLAAALDGDLQRTHLSIGIKSDIVENYTFWLTGDQDGITFAIPYECPGCMSTYESITSKSRGAIPLEASCPAVYALLAAPLAILCCLCACLCAVCRERERRADAVRREQHVALLHGPQGVAYQQPAAYQVGAVPATPTPQQGSTSAEGYVQ